MIFVKPSHEILTEIDGSDILKRIEKAGRVCYKSEDKITEDSAGTFVKILIGRGHHSVLEHENISVKFICDRGVTHEIVRHRLAAYSQESTRYCNYRGGVIFIIPPWIDDVDIGQWTGIKIAKRLLRDSLKSSSADWVLHMMKVEELYINLLKSEWSPQQARSVLPNSLKTEIVMTANLREWRHVLKLRCSKAAHPQMRELMNPLLGQLKEIIPVIFNDIEGNCVVRNEIKEV